MSVGSDVLFFLRIIILYTDSVQSCLSRRSSKLRMVVFELIDSQGLTHKMWVNECHTAYAGGTRQRTWLGHCSTIRKFAVSIPDGVIGIDIILPAALWP